MTRKGILLAGGTGSRLWPITLGVSKQLLPIYDKPMIYYPIAVLMLAGIREIAIITTPEDQPQFQRLLGDGRQWGLAFTWIVQERPEGLAQAYLLTRDFLAGAPSAMCLGDNIFFGHGLPEILHRASGQASGGTVFGYHVSDPERYGVAAFDASGKVTRIVEKPKSPPSNFAITGLYFLDGARPTSPRGSNPPRAGNSKSSMSWNTTGPKARFRSSAWAGVSPGWIPGPPAAFSTPGTSCGPCRIGRECRSARRTRSPSARVGSTAQAWANAPGSSASPAMARIWTQF